MRIEIKPRENLPEWCERIELVAETSEEAKLLEALVVDLTLGKQASLDPSRMPSFEVTGVPVKLPMPRGKCPVCFRLISGRLGNNGLVTMRKHRMGNPKGDGIDRLDRRWCRGRRGLRAV